MLPIKSHKEAIIQSTPLFKGLTDSQTALMKDQFSQKAFKKNETIFFEGDPAHGFFVVAEGKIKIYKLAPDGKEKILHIYGPGNPFGEVPVFSGSQYPANATALTHSRVFYISRDAFINAIKLHPSLALQYVRRTLQTVTRVHRPDRKPGLERGSGKACHLSHLSDPGAR